VTSVPAGTRIPAPHAFDAALRTGAGALVGLGSGPVRVPVRRWTGDVSRSDRAVLRHCHGRVIDLGCGPGRMAEELRRLGHPVLGVDLSADAVRRTRARGVHAVRGDVLLPLPGEGVWDTALLADGNVGIGGDPVRLLERVHSLVRPGGTVVVDLAPPGCGLGIHEVWLVVDEMHSHPFPWAVVGVDAVDAVVEPTGLAVRSTHSWRDRWFAVLARPEEDPWAA
jgi:SAM-dependent methyltransferase